MTNQQLPPNAMSRRQMMKTMQGCAALTSASMLSQMLNLKLTRSVMADVDQVGGYKAIVCMFLYGGIDSYHMLVPNDDQGYDDYAAARTNMALAREDLLPITASDGREFGLHPNLADMQELFNGGDLGFVGNIGALIEPTDLQSYRNGISLPLGLFSHNDQQQHWQTSVPQSRSQITGWAGRMADCLTDASNANSSVSMNISLGNLNIMQTGDAVIPYVVGTGGATTLSNYNDNWEANRMFKRITDGLLEQTYSDLLAKTHATTRRGAIDGAIAFNEATNGVELTTEFPASGIGQQLQMVARSIAARDTLDQSRQIFFVARGGWDHHDNMLNNTSVMFPEIAAAMKAFNAAMIELGVHDDVAFFSASDFGRTLTSNGDGTDHAWGGNALVMGGGIQGGTIHGGPNSGGFPDTLALGNSLDTGRGRLIPTTSVDELAAELALWFGVPNDSNLETILPNIRNFHATGASGGPIGMFS